MVKSIKLHSFYAPFEKPIEALLHCPLHVPLSWQFSTSFGRLPKHPQLCATKTEPYRGNHLSLAWGMVMRSSVPAAMAAPMHWSSCLAWALDVSKEKPAGALPGRSSNSCKTFYFFFEIHSTHCPQIYMKPGLDRRKTRRSRSLPLAWCTLSSWKWGRDNKWICFFEVDFCLTADCLGGFRCWPGSWRTRCAPGCQCGIASSRQLVFGGAKV